MDLSWLVRKWFVLEQLKNKFHAWEWQTPVHLFNWNCLDTLPNVLQRFGPVGRIFGMSLLKFSVHFDGKRIPMVKLHRIKWCTNTGSIHFVCQAERAGSFLCLTDWLRHFLNCAANVSVLPPHVQFDGRRIHDANCTKRPWDL